MRTHLHFAFLARDARLGVNHHLELGIVFGLVARGVSLVLFRDDVAIHVLFPDVVREALRFVQVDDVVQALAVVAVLETLRHHGIDLDERKVQAALVLEQLRDVRLHGHGTRKQVVHFPAVLFQALQVRLVARVQQLVAPAFRHREPLQQGIVAFVKALYAEHVAVNRLDVDVLDTPGQFRRHVVLEVTAGLVHLVLAFYHEGIARRGEVHVHIGGRDGPHLFFTLQVDCRKIALGIKFNVYGSANLVVDGHFGLSASRKH